MKKIINGKMYNTDTAEYLDGWSNGEGCSDFRYCNECLYRKKTGEFFLDGEGGPMTKYAQRCGDGWYCGGEIITPLTEAEAKKWAEEHMDPDKYIQVFGPVAE